MPNDDLKERAKAFVRRAVDRSMGTERRVSAEAWSVAVMIAETALQAAGRCIPLSDAVDGTMRAFEAAGLGLVRQKDVDELLAAADDYGISRVFATDSVKLRRVKNALAALRQHRISPAILLRDVQRDVPGAGQLDDFDTE